MVFDTSPVELAGTENLGHLMRSGGVPPTLDSQIIDIGGRRRVQERDFGKMEAPARKGS